MLMQLPIGKEDNFEGVIDLITHEGHLFRRQQRRECPPRSRSRPRCRTKPPPPGSTCSKRWSMYSDEMMELLLAEQEVPEELIHAIVKAAVQGQDVTPVFMGTAYSNKGVQPLLDAVVRYLPSPLERQVAAKAYDKPDEKFPLEPDPEKPFVGMAFKIVEDPYGQLTFMRIYQGTINKGEMHFNQRTGQKQRFSRIVQDARRQARGNRLAPSAGDIVAIMGIDCASGDTYASQNEVLHAGKHVRRPSRSSRWPSPRSIARRRRRLSKALQRFTQGRSRPSASPPTKKPAKRVIAGMGELHLEIYVERIRREYKVEVEVGAPKVSYREAPTKKAEYNYKHKKQTGGSGQYAHIVGHFEPLPDDAEETFEFEDDVIGGRIPREYIPSVEKGFRDSLQQGPAGRLPDRRREDRAGRRLVPRCRQLGHGVPDLRPRLLPRDVPEDEAGAAGADHEARSRSADQLPRLGRRRTDQPPRHDRVDRSGGRMAVIEAEVPLAETFGYSTDLRSMTQGQGTFTMEFCKYRRVPASIQEEIMAEKKEAAGRGQVSYPRRDSLLA